MNTIGAKTVKEGSLLSFVISATDADADNLTYSAFGLPSGATFEAFTRVFSWTPTLSQAGTFSNVQFGVSDGSLSDYENITILVNNTNQAPILSTIGSKTVNEGSLLTFVISATDADGDNLTYSALSLPTGATFDASTRTFSWTPTYSQSGKYWDACFQVSDGSLGDSEYLVMTVNNTNRPPILTGIGNKTVDEGQFLSFVVSATDADGDNLIYSVSNLPIGATFFLSTRIFNWTPTYSQYGTYSNVRFQVSDGSLSDYENITIIANDVNRVPVALDDAFSTPKGTTLNITAPGVLANDTDADNNPLNVALVSSSSKGTLTLNPNGSFSYTPSLNYSGTDSFTYKVNDGKADSNVSAVSINVYTTVALNNSSFESDANSDGIPDGWVVDKTYIRQSATYASDGSKSLKFNMTSSDTNARKAFSSLMPVNSGKSYSISMDSYYSGIMNATGAYVYICYYTTTDDSGTEAYSYIASAPKISGTWKTSALTWTPPATTKSFKLLLYAESTAVTSLYWDNIKVMANTLNTVPVLATIGNKTVDEGSTLNFTVSATDADNDTLTYSASNLPSGAAFDASTKTFNWTPTYSQAGMYNNVQFSVSDGSLTASETISIDVVEEASVDVSVTLQGSGRPDAGWVVPLTVNLFTPGADVLTGIPVYTFDLTTAKSDSFAVVQVSGIIPGTYDISATTPHCLTNVKRGVVITASSTAVDLGIMLEGNADDDNAINIADFGIMATLYGKSSGDIGYDVHADFDRNGIVNISDFSLLAGNFGKIAPVEVP